MNTKQIKIIATILFIVSVISCGSDPAPEDPRNIIFENLTSGTWTTEKVTRDGSDITDEYPDFTISFSSFSYTTSNGSKAWDSSGNWDWNDSNATSILLSNGIIVTLSFSNNNEALTLSFIVPETIYNGGRPHSLKGSYVFLLNK